MIDDEFKAKETQHSALGASSASRWMNCPGSVRLIKSLGTGVKRSGAEAVLGTAAHTLAAACLTDKTDAWEHVGREIVAEDNKFIVDQDMVDAVQVYVDHARFKAAQHAESSPDILIEHGMSSILDSEAYGTSDFMILVGAELLIVLDYKHGQNVCVEPSTEQMKYYGYLGVENYNLPDEARVELHIVQPRMPHPRGPKRMIVLTAGELRIWFQTEVLPAMERTRQPNAVLVLGEWCRFCPARDACPAIRRTAEEIPVARPLESLSLDEIGGLMQKSDSIKKFLDAVDAEGFRRVMGGAIVPGQKLVQKRANRVWKEDAEAYLKGRYGDQAYETKLLTPPNIEKLEDGKKAAARFAYTPNTGLTLAPESDKRTEVRRVMDQFLDGQAAIASLN